MIDIPEILHYISSYLDPKALIACTQVSRQWNNIFTRCLWLTLDDSINPWRRLFVAHRVSVTNGIFGATISISYDDRQKCLSDMLQSRGHYVRYLSFTKGMTLAAALDSGTMTQLHSLTLRLNLSDWNLGNLRDGEGSSTSRISTMMKAKGIEVGGHQLNDLVPVSAFDPQQAHGVRMDMTRAHWLLVLMNLGLSRLYFRSPGFCQFAVDKDNVGGGSLTLASQSFLVNTFSRLRAIRYLELGMNADTFIIHNLGTLLPNLVSFVHTDYAAFDLEALQREPPHCALRTLEFRQATVTAGQLRAIMVAFPALTRLSVDNTRTSSLNNNNNNSASSSNANIPADKTLDHNVLEHSTLESLWIRHQPRIDLLRTQIRFPKVRRLQQPVFVNNSHEIQQLFWVFPALEQYDSGHRDMNYRKPLRADEVLKNDRVYPIRSLVLCPGDALNFTLNSLVARMPFLTRLSISRGCFIDGCTLTEVARNCRNLQDITFNMEKECSQGLINLFVGCSKLRTCRGMRHVLLAERVIESPEWSCVGLEELDIEIAGVPRLTEAQESLLNALIPIAHDRRLFKSAIPATTTTTNEDQHAVVECIRQKLKERGHEATPDEAAALEQRQISHAVQKKIYRRLGRLTRLQQLDFSIQDGSEVEPTERLIETLEFSLASGLAELGSLDGIRKICFKYTNHRIEEDDARWITNRWEVKQAYGSMSFYR